MTTARRAGERRSHRLGDGFEVVAALQEEHGRNLAEAVTQRGGHRSVVGRFDSQRCEWITYMGVVTGRHEQYVGCKLIHDGQHDTLQSVEMGGPGRT